MKGPDVSKVVIVGGGLTGLSAAYFLEKTTDLRIVLLESANAVGGKLVTISHNRFLIEEGPDCFFTKKPAAIELATELGIADRLIEPLQRQFMMLVGGVLHPVPSKLASFLYADPAMVELADFVSAEGRERAKAEPFQPVGKGDDESICSFFRRRFGVEFSEKLAEPLLAGTHAGGANKLSMRALYPSYLDAERSHGSLNAAALNRESSEIGQPQTAAFMSFANGMGELIEALRGSLRRTEIRTGTHIKSIEEGGVHLSDEFVSSGATLITAPSYAAADLVRAALPNLADQLSEIEFASSRIATFAFKRSQIGGSLSCTGFLVTETDPGHISGCTFASEKWLGRAPEDSVLQRIFLRNDSSPVEGLTQIKGLLEISGDPILSRETAWTHGLPQYNIGHLERISAIEAHLENVPWLYLAGTSYQGVGVPDCIRQAKNAASKIAGHLSRLTSGLR